MFKYTLFTNKRVHTDGLLVSLIERDQPVQMSKQFIATATAGQAHEADIYAVALTKPYTLTAGGDGFLKLWDNSISETDTAKSHVKELFVDSSGLHHLDTFEDTIDGVRRTLVAAVTFSGRIKFVSIYNNEPSLLDLNINEGTTDAYWSVRFLKDTTVAQTHRLAATSPTGSVSIWNLSFTSSSSNDSPAFILHTTIAPQTKSFAMSLDLNSELGLLATGYQNGDVTITSIQTGKPVHTFRTPGLKHTNASSSAARCVRFSPLGKILAVGADSGAHGTVTIWDTTYGENVGSFTAPSHSTSTPIGAYAHEGFVFGLDFNESGESLVSAGYDGKVRVWNVGTREREATITISPTDVDDEEVEIDEDGGACSAFGVSWVRKGMRGGAGGDVNEGLVVVGKDRGVRWYREAGGI